CQPQLTPVSTAPRRRRDALIPDRRFRARSNPAARRSARGGYLRTAIPLPLIGLRSQNPSPPSRQIPGHAFFRDHALAHSGDFADEGRERRKLLLDEIAGRLVRELASLLVEFGGAVADEDLRLVERVGVEKHHGSPQVVLHAPAPERTGG